jgi:hypothetical protein
MMAVFVCMMLAVPAEERFLVQCGYRADSEVVVLKPFDYIGMHDPTDRAHDGKERSDRSRWPA